MEKWDKFWWTEGVTFSIKSNNVRRNGEVSILAKLHVRKIAMR